MKSMLRFAFGLCFLFILGCSQNKSNYVVTQPFLMPKGKSQIAKFNNLYPTNQISDVDVKLAAQESEKYLNPPTVG